MKFVDTSFWVALFFDRDAHHPAARVLWGQQPGALLCTNHVLGETWTFVRRRQGHDDAVRVLDAVSASRRVAVIRVGQDEEQEAWEWLRRRTDREYSFVDATSFAVMSRRRISTALAFDADFSAAGFVEARP